MRIVIDTDEENASKIFWDSPLLVDDAVTANDIFQSLLLKASDSDRLHDRLLNDKDIKQIPINY